MEPKASLVTPAQAGVQTGRVELLERLGGSLSAWTAAIERARHASQAWLDNAGHCPPVQSGVTQFVLGLPLLLLPTFAAAQTPPAPSNEPEIVVRAVRGKCRVQIAERTLSESEFSVRSKEWAALGTPVRAIAPDGASYKCLAKIAFKLNKQGVRLIHFVDRDEEAGPFQAHDQ